jgi:hypothetical protein
MNRVDQPPIETLPVRRPVEDIVAELENLFAETGAQCFSRAVRALNQATVQGRPARDDALALIEVTWLVDSGSVRSLNEALLRVASAIEPTQNPKSVAERLRRKYFQNHPRKCFVDERTMASSGMKESKK